MNRLPTMPDQWGTWCEINVQLWPIAVSSPENSISMLMSHSNKSKFLLPWKSVNPLPLI